ncbi:MAG: HlyD family efflux transporter periplasmic adaptor subunit [Ruminococcaceae bacterium]|nr:HlyD family efflux transporter periplasmic adaptor subunit [Oscillospiraceae bacterium]
MKKLKGFIKKHKVLTTMISIILVGAIAATAIFASRSGNSGQSYSFIRTTTLQKGTLEDSISATGTVSSAKTSKVTTNLNYTVKSVNVSVGDEVKEGDTIITLDTSELESQIEKEENNLAKTKASAQTQYDSALTAYNTAKEKLSSYASTLSDAKTAYTKAKTPYDKAVSSLKSYQNAYDKALANYNTAGANYVKALASYNSAVSGYKSGSVSKSKLQSAAKAYMTAVQNYLGGCAVGNVDISDSASATQQNTNAMSGESATSSSSVSVTKTANDICQEVVANVRTLTGKTLSVPSGSNTLYKLATKAKALRNAKTACNFATLESAYTSAKSAYEQAKSSAEQYENEVTQAKSQLSQAKEALSNASSSDTLDELKSQLSECQLKAEQDGTVTALSATVGSTCNMESAATIQDLSALQVDITIAEADINNAKLGQACHITSDASDETLDGTLTQIDPTSDNGSFGATVKITSATSSLHIGMNASVDIIVSSSEDVYQVPIDAVGDDNGTSFVYRKISGEGTDMQFEKINVTTGDSNDYYIEISSDELAEGDVIRSSADLSEGVDTVSADSKDNESSGGLFASLFGGMNSNRGGDMHGNGGSPPDFNNNSGSSSSGGDMPSPPSGGNGGGQNG